MISWFERSVDPYPAQEPAPPPARLLRFIWAGTVGARRQLAAMAVCAGAIGVFEAALFSMLGGIVDTLAATTPQRLWADHGDTLVTLAAVIVSSVALVGAWCLLKYQALAPNLPMRLRWNFHRMMLGQSLAFYQDEFAGRVATKVMQTALAVRDTLMVVVDVMVFIAVYFVTMMIAVSVFDLTLVAPFAIWLVLYVIALVFFVPRMGKVATDQADARSLMTGRISDAYTNIATVKLFSHAGREADYARDAMQEFMVTARRQFRLVAGFEVINHVLCMMLIISTAGVALWAWSDGRVGPGAVAAASAMALRLNGLSHWIMWELASLFEHIGTVQDGMNTLASARKVVDRPDAPPLVVKRGEIHFEQVRFTYVEHRPPVFDALDLHIHAGEKIGLVGPSGAGKSTLVNLLLRFHDVQAGRILIDGQDVAAVAQRSLRAHIGMVTQDNALLHRSVRENVLYGRPDAVLADVQRALRDAHAEDFIVHLVDKAGRRGLDAHVGERGVKLSGGQRQRVAIARVMLKDAPILLLDEATSALDSEVEAAIQESLGRLMAGKTVIAIAHRLSTIAAMDRLVVMDGGRIIEQGDHRSLLAQGGLYARLWARQSGGFIGAAGETAALDEGARPGAGGPVIAPRVAINDWSRHV